MDPVRELPYWPAAMALLIDAGQMTASDYVPTYPKIPLASKGASTDAIFAAVARNGTKLLLDRLQQPPLHRREHACKIMPALQHLAVFAE
jgi:hypothetical protein